MYHATIGWWHVVDPLADSFSIVSPYNYVLNNPIMLIDPYGEDVVLYNNNGVELVRFFHENIKVEFNLDTEIAFEKPIELDLDEMAKQLGVDKIDAVGLGVESSGTLGGGLNVGIEFVYFFSGEDEGKLYSYVKGGGNAGLEAGVGGYAFAASKNQDDVNAESWEGKFNFYSGGYEFVSSGYFWSNTDDKTSLWPGQSNREISWQGITVGGAYSGQLKWGAKWGVSVYKLLSKRPIISNNK